MHVFLLILLALCGTCIILYWLYNALTADHKMSNNKFEFHEYPALVSVFQVVDFA